LVIDGEQNNRTDYCDPLIQAGLDNVSSFDPCNCADNQIASVGGGFYQNYKESDLDTAYCGTYSKEWKLYDASTGESSADVLTNGTFTNTCTDGACDVRFKVDDFIAKVPVLNQSYVSGFYDFKHLEQFPACTNAGIGFERFIEYTSMDTIDTNVNFCIDWKLKETLSEIDYDPVSSYHLNEYTHNKSLLKAEKVSRTCGNFILKDVVSNYSGQYSMYDDMNTSVEIPSTGDFTKPYGFEGKSHNNLFIGGSKLASHWKWNVTSGILGWYRHYDINRVDDQRPIPGVDLYISQGDVFWAETDGPEPDNAGYDFAATSSDSFIKNCPSGLKVVDGNTFKGIVPNGSEAVYISHNIYPKFYQFYEKYILLGQSHTNAFRLASIMATSPLYDGYTVDLLATSGPSLYDDFNDYEQIAKLSSDMLKTTDYKSVNGLYYISNTKNLVDTLFHKYGGYLWVPPNSNGLIEFNLDVSANSIYFDMDFDMVVDKTITERAGRKKHRRQPTPSCDLSADVPYNIYYDQSITAGQSTVSSNVESFYRYSAGCNEGTFTPNDAARYANIALNGNDFVSTPVMANGSYTLSGVYPRISESSSDGIGCRDCNANSSFYLVQNAEAALCTPPAAQQGEQRQDSKTFCYDTLSFFLNNSEGPGKPNGERPQRTIIDSTEYDYRRYKSLPFNPHIDLVAFHEQGGVYFNSSVFGQDRSLTFDRNATNNKPESVKIKFDTKDVGIKIYSLYVERLQSSDSDSLYCKRFPINYNNTCKCYGLNLSRHNSHPYSCQDGDAVPAKSYSNVSYYIPNLSTQYSPKLRPYGGYSLSEVKELFGLDVPEAGASVLPIISDKLDPENPYSCEQSKSITLGNYTVTKLNINLDNFSTDHADIYASVSETANYTIAPIRYVFTIDGYEEHHINSDWKRFVNKVTLGDTTLYNNQKKVLYGQSQSLPKEIPVKVVNPYLVAIMGGEEQVLKPPIDIEYAGGGVTGIFGGRGDELSTVNITIEQKPRKQLLTFKFNPQQSSNLATFTKKKFDPEYGLLQPNKDLAAGSFLSFLDDGSVNYSGVLPRKQASINALASAAEVVNENLEEAETIIAEAQEANKCVNTNTLSTPLTSNIKNILNSISFFDTHKKPRLYLNYGGCWYIAKLSNRGGFEIADRQYIGKPAFYEYIRNINDATYTGCVMPVMPKKPIYLKGNSRTGGHINDRSLLKGTRIGKYKFKLPGAAPYFRARESRTIHEVSAKNIETYVTSPKPDVKFKELISLKDKDGYYIYTGPQDTDFKNYVFIGNDPNVLENNTNLEIDYTNASVNGLVYNTSVTCDEKVLFQANAFESRDNTIIRKSLVVDLYDQDGSPVDSSYTKKKSFKVFTQFELANPLPQGYDYLDFIDNSRVLLYDPSPGSTDNNSLLSNELYQVKWGDLLKYDGFLLNNPFMQKLSSGGLPKTEYENLLYKLIVNDRSYTHLFVTSKGVKVEQNNPYFFMRQKYNLGEDDSYSDDVSIYQNFLPVLEVILDKDNSLVDIPPEVTKALQDLARNPNSQKLIEAANKAKELIALDYNVYHSALFSNYTKDEDISDESMNPDGSLFITDIQDLETAYMPDPSENFYTETYKISDPLFWLDKTIKVKPTNREGKLIEPSNMNTVTNNMTLSCFNTDTITRTSAFYTENLLSDMDKPNGCGPQDSISDYRTGQVATCIIKNLGSIELRSKFKIGKPRNLIFNDLRSSEIKGFISYEGGLYNPMGDTRFTQIVRTELPLDNPIDSELTCLSTTKMPTYSKTMTSMYQDYIENNKNDTTHSKIVKNMDLHANEMLFRILYGEKTPINRTQLFVDQKPLSKNDLLVGGTPQIKAKNIYDEILYNYDKQATSAINSTGSYTINGKRGIGDSVSFTIGDVSVNLTISQSGEDVIITGNIGSETVNTVLYASKYLEKSLIRQVYGFGSDPGDIPAPPSPSNDNETIELVSTKGYQTDGRIEGTGPPGIVGLERCGESCIYYPTDGYVWALTAPGRYTRGVVEAPTPCHPGTKPGDPFSYGYCRVDEEAGNCTNCELFEELEPGAAGSINVEYSFEDCSKKFNLYAHSYRERYAGSTAVDEEIPEDTGGDSGDSGSTEVDMETYGHSTSGHNAWGCHPESIRGYQDVRGCGEYGVVDGIELTQKVFVRTETQEAEPYSSSKCPGHFFTVNFTNKTLTVVLPNNKATKSPTTGAISQGGGSKTYCVDLNINGCPNVSVSLPAGYTVSENLNSSCETDCSNDANITVPTQDRQFSTQTYTAVCILGSRGYGAVNGLGVALTTTGIRPDDGRGDFGRPLPPCYGNAGFIHALCDGSGAPWYACHEPVLVHAGWGLRNGYSKLVRYTDANGTSKSRYETVPGSGGATFSCSSQGHGYQQHDMWHSGHNAWNGWLSHLQYKIWKDSLIRSFNNNLATNHGGYGYSVGPYTGSSQACQVITNIPEDEIFEGVVPGSCELKFYEYTKTFGKVRQQGIGNTEVGSWTMSYSVAYIQYKYKSTATISSTQTVDDSEGEVIFDSSGIYQAVKTNNPLRNCHFNSFPDSFGYVDFQNINRGVPVQSYIDTTPMFSKTACDNSVSSYNSYDELQTICGYDDWQCWAVNGRHASSFLQRQRPYETWN
jgi:hypothetical protein